MVKNGVYIFYFIVINLTGNGLYIWTTDQAPCSRQMIPFRADATQTVCPLFFHI